MSGSNELYILDLYKVIFFYLPVCPLIEMAPHHIVVTPIILHTVGILLANGDGRKHFGTYRVGGSGCGEDLNSLYVNVYLIAPPVGRQCFKSSSYF